VALVAGRDDEGDNLPLQRSERARLEEGRGLEEALEGFG